VEPRERMCPSVMDTGNRRCEQQLETTVNIATITKFDLDDFGNASPSKYDRARQAIHVSNNGRQHTR
jgi:hypothetical protein